MASLRVNPIVPLGTTLNKIGRRLLTVSMVKNDGYKKSLKPVGGVISAASLSLSNPLPPQSSSSIIAKNDNDKRKGKSISSRNLDEWMKVSMEDIIKNLKEAPLLVHVYYTNYENERQRGQRRPPPPLIIKTERAQLEKWPVIESEWKIGKTKTPDGLIFVQELRDDEEEENLVEDSEDEGLTKSWGVIVQGKGIEFGPACYLLKTSRVRAGRGMDLFCTHFCLVRVKNFRDSALKQFKGCWL